MTTQNRISTDDGLQRCLDVYGGTNATQDALRFGYAAASLYWYKQMQDAGCVAGAAIIRHGVDNEFKSSGKDLTTTAE